MPHRGQTPNGTTGVFPSLGYELNLGPLALRAGYKNESGSNATFFGTGIRISQFQLHYAANFIPTKDLHHQFSMTYSFGGSDSLVLVRESQISIRGITESEKYVKPSK